MTTKVQLQNGAIPKAAPESVGVSSRSILNYMDRVREEGLGLHAFQIVRHGRLIADAVARPYSHDSFHRIYSAAKGIVATAVLLTIQDGHYTLDEPVLKHFPKEWLPEDPDPRWERLTLYHLLTMTAGHSKDTMFSMLVGKSPCWVRTFFEIKPDYEPGTHFVYDMGVQYVMNELVRLAVGKDLGQFMDERIFGPMGVRAQWRYTPIEGNFWSSSMQLQPEGLTRLSLLYLQDGEWDGRQLVDRDLIRCAKLQHVPSTPAFPERAAREDFAGYSLHMWRNSFGGLRYSGGQGQYGVIVPEYDMVYSTLAAGGGNSLLLDIFYEEILRKSSERPLPPDPDSFEELRRRIGDFGLGPQGVKKHSPLEAAVSGRTFYFDDNGSGQKSVRFDFQDDRAVILTDSERGRRQHFCGFMGEWLDSTGYLLIDKEDGEIADLDRIFFYDEKQTCLTGGWSADDTFIFKLRGPAMLCDYTYVCRFGDGTVDIEQSSTCHGDPVKRMGEASENRTSVLHGRAVPL
ncbi:MAG: beta-lactamase family protein [Firmicutes bacterium]|nr:beta-lactamase family protein [Bacillota bacterium]